MQPEEKELKPTKVLIIKQGQFFTEKVKMTRAERRRQERGIFPCAGCGKRVKINKTEVGFCLGCWNLLGDDSKKRIHQLLLDSRKRMKGEVPTVQEGGPRGPDSNIDKVQSEGQNV